MDKNDVKLNLIYKYLLIYSLIKYRKLNNTNYIESFVLL